MVTRTVHERLQRQHDGVDLGLGVVDDVVDVAAVGRVAELDDARARGA